MAITIIKQPYANSPAHNPLIYKVSTTNQEQANFKFVADVYVDSNMVARLKPFIDYGSVNECTIDISNIVSSYVSGSANDVIVASGGDVMMYDSKVDVQVKFGEEYGSTAVVYADLTLSTERPFHNKALNYKMYVAWQTSMPAFGFGSGSHFLTNFAGTRRVIVGQKAVMVALYNHQPVSIPQTYNKWIIKQYDKDGTLLNTEYEDVTRLISDSNYYCSISVLEAFTRLWNCSHFTISCGRQIDVGTYTDGVEYRYDFEDADCRHEVYRVHWLNRLGGYDSFNFKALSRTSFDVERKTYNTDEPRVTYANSDFRKKHTLVKYDERIELNSGFIKEAEAEWIEEIFTSPIVLLEHNGLFYSAIIDDSTYERKKSRQGEKLINVGITAKYSQSNFTQHG